MKWSEKYSPAEEPSLEQISEFIASPLWEDFSFHLQDCYGVSPSVQYSSCCGAPGWNVKYKKSGRALCTLYPDDGFFTCLVTIGNREAVEAELLLPFLTDDIRELYKSVKPMNGARWLMIDVTSLEILEDTKRLIALRVRKKQS